MTLPGTPPPIPEDRYIQFDNLQLTLRTDVAAVTEFVVDTYEHMLVAEAVAEAGRIDVAKTATGYRVRAANETNLIGDDPAPLLSFLREEVILHFIRARPDLLWLHAGAVERNDAALLFCGPSGSGKSTLVSALCGDGWRLMSDDVAPVHMQVNMVLPFQHSPVRRISVNPAYRTDDISTLELETVRMAPDRIRRSPARVGAIIFPHYRPGEPQHLQKLAEGSAAFEILLNARNFVDHKGGAVQRAADFARGVPAFRLRYGVSSDAITSLDGIG